MLETICDILVEAYKRNWITSRDGNVSIRHHDRDHFYVTPSGVRKQTLQPDQFKKIKINFKNEVKLWFLNLIHLFILKWGVSSIFHHNTTPFGVKMFYSQVPRPKFGMSLNLRNLQFAGE